MSSISDRIIQRMTELKVQLYNWMTTNINFGD